MTTPCKTPICLACNMGPCHNQRQTTTTDTEALVRRLRGDAQGEDLGAEGMGWSPDPDLKRQAADTIERLTRERDEAVAKERERCARICDRTPPFPFRPSIEAAHAIRTTKDDMTTQNLVDSGAQPLDNRDP